jgi:hypothetical protein
VSNQKSVHIGVTLARLRYALQFTATWGTVAQRAINLHTRAARKPNDPGMTQDSPTYWKNARTEVRAAGFDPDRAAKTNAVITVASAYTNAHRCNNRVRQITDLLVELIAERTR